MTDDQTTIVGTTIVGNDERAIVRVDLVARVGLAAGVAFLLQPWWAEGFRYGFFVTILFTVAHIITSHLVHGKEVV